MNIPIDDVQSILSKFNPWWKPDAVSLPSQWRRAIFNELFQWVYHPPTHRAVLLSGARQVGKTTLLLQVIDKLLNAHVPAANILYVTFDHPLIKLAGIEAVMQAWRLREPRAPGQEYIFLDEAQFIPDGETWIKHQVDFNKDRTIVFTGSAMPLIHRWQESGTGRWHTLKLSTLSFYEYIQLGNEYRLKKHHVLQNLLSSRQLSPALIKHAPPSIPTLPPLASFRELLTWDTQQFRVVTEQALPFVSHFHEYLMKGGFPQFVQIDDINQAQRLLREDIIDKVIKRDMTALFNVRHILDLERIFLYLCMHDGALLDLKVLCENLEVKRPTVEKYIELLEATHLIYKLQPFGYGKDILRAKYKIYLADAAISSAVLLKGKSLLDNAPELGAATETAVYKHIYSSLYAKSIGFSYWQGKDKNEVDIIAQLNHEAVPFEIKYRHQHARINEMKGFLEFCSAKKPSIGYVVTKSIHDFDYRMLPELNIPIIRIPAPLFCYWMGESEHQPDVNFI